MRFFGGLLTVAAFFLCGTSVAGEVRRELRATEAVLSLLRELSRKLTWGCEPLKRVFASYRDPLLEKAGFLSLLRAADGRNYPAAWASAMETLPFPAAARRALQTFGESLGRLPLETQKEQLSLCIAALEAERQEALTHAEQKRRSTVALWTLAGLLIAVLLL